MTTTSSGRRSGLSTLVAVVALMLFIAACGDQEMDAGPESSKSTEDTTEIRLSVSGGEAGAVKQASQVARARLSALGIKGATVSPDGTQIMVRVPVDGATMAQQALEPVGQLEFRPVLAILGSETGNEASPTPPGEMSAGAEVALTATDGTVYKLGPVALDGGAVKSSSASADQQGLWSVNPVLSTDPDGPGINSFNAIAAKCYSGSPECPDVGGGRGQLGIVLDGVILSAPTINSPSFGAGEIQISGGFDENEAQTLSAVLAGGVAPTSWTLEN